MQPVRVDDGCYSRLTEKARGMPVPFGFDATRSVPSSTLHQGYMEPRGARVEDSFDADLKKALEMSLEEVKAHSSSGYVPQSQTRGPVPSVTKDVKKVDTKKESEEEDADLKAAIAASLKDMEEQKQKHAATFKERSVTLNGTVTAVPETNAYELTPVEAENINLFATLVDRLQHQAPGTILREPQIQELYDSIGKLRPKLARTYGETMSKYGSLTTRE